MGKLDGKVAVITGATSGMALAGARLFVDEGAHVFISGRAIASRLQPVSSEFVLALPETSPVERVRSRTGQRP